MNSIIKERTMFWSCWLDNKGAAIPHLPPHPPTMAPQQIISFAIKECIVGKIICNTNADRNPTSKAPGLFFLYKEMKERLCCWFSVLWAPWNTTAAKENGDCSCQYSSVSFWVPPILVPHLGPVCPDWPSQGHRAPRNSEFRSQHHCDITWEPSRPSKPSARWESLMSFLEFGASHWTLVVFLFLDWHWWAELSSGLHQNAFQA